MDRLSPPSHRNRNHHLAFFPCWKPSASPSPLLSSHSTGGAAREREQGLGRGVGDEAITWEQTVIMAADALLHFHSCGVAHLWAAITNQMIQTELCDEVAGLSEYSCTVLLCLCAQHWPMCCETAWSCCRHWVCVEASSGRDSHVVPCNTCLCAWSIHNQNYCWDGSFCTLSCFILGVDFEVATKKEWRLVATNEVKTPIRVQPWRLRACPAALASASVELVQQAGLSSTDQRQQCCLPQAAFEYVTVGTA